MRLMALLMLGSKASGSPVPFTDIQAALDITPEQVGGKVAAAMQSFGSKRLTTALDLSSNESRLLGEAVS
jgi:hypothetical protein